jgi:hypothetical protein
MKLSDRVTTVKYLGKHGTELDNERANKHLVADQVYKVTGLDVGGWSSIVYLEGFGDITFNTVMFEEVHIHELELDEIFEEIELYCKNNNLSVNNFIERLKEYDLIGN